MNVFLLIPPLLILSNQTHSYKYNVKKSMYVIVVACVAHVVYKSIFTSTFIQSNLHYRDHPGKPEQYTQIIMIKYLYHHSRWPLDSN